ncbi:MAG: hypothetical protein Q9170_003618 [Blastenia crenularia]
MTGTRSIALTTQATVALSSTVIVTGKPSTIGSAPTGSSATTVSSGSNNNDNSAHSEFPKAPVIFGAIVGFAFAVIAIWLVWRGITRRKSSRLGKVKTDERKNQVPQQDSPQVDEGLGVFGSGGPSNNPLGTADRVTSCGEMADVMGKQVPYSPQSFLHHSDNVSAPSSTLSPNNYGVFPADSPALLPEMSGTSSPTPELSPNPEKSRINPTLSKCNNEGGSGPSGQPSLPSSAEANLMRPNLEISHEQRNQGNNHVPRRRAANSATSTEAWDISACAGAWEQMEGRPKVRERVDDSVPR